MTALKTIFFVLLVPAGVAGDEPPAHDSRNSNRPYLSKPSTSSRICFKVG